MRAVGVEEGAAGGSCPTHLVAPSAVSRVCFRRRRLLGRGSGGVREPEHLIELGHREHLADLRLNPGERQLLPTCLAPVRHQEQQGQARDDRDAGQVDDEERRGGLG